MVLLQGGAKLPGNKKADVTDTPSADDVLTYNAVKDQFDAQPPPGAGGGEANTASNSGTGAGLAQTKVGVDLPFRSIIGGTGLTATQNTNDVTLDHDAHTGDVTGSTSLTIANEAVTYAKMQHVSATDRFLGRDTAGAGDVEEIAMSSARTMLNVEDGANNYTHPNHTGDVTSTGDGATAIATGVIVNADINNSAAIALSKLATDPLARANHTGTQTASTISDYASATATWTNKTFDANGTGNSLSNVDVADLSNGTDGELITWDSAGSPATVAVGTSGQVLTSNGAGAAPTFQAAGAASLPVTDTTSIAEGSADATKEVRFEVDGNTTGIVGVLATAFTTAKTVTFPDATDTLMGKATTDTMTNKTFDANGTGNSLSNVDVADLATGTDGELITWDSSGNPATVAVGTSGQVLTSNGAGAAPTFQAAGGGGATDTEFPVPLVQEIGEDTVAYSDAHDLATASAHVTGWVLPDGAATATINLKTMHPIPDDLASTPAARIEFVILTKGAVAGPADVRLTVSSLAVADTENFDQAFTAETETTVTMPTATETQDKYSQDMTNDPVAGDTVLVKLQRDPTDAADDFTDDIQIVSATLWIHRST